MQICLISNHSFVISTEQREWRDLLEIKFFHPFPNWGRLQIDFSTTLEMTLLGCNFSTSLKMTLLGDDFPTVLEMTLLGDDLSTVLEMKVCEW